LELYPSGESARSLGIEGFVEGSGGVDVEVVHYQAYLLGLRVEILGQVAHELGELASTPALAHLHASPAREGFEGHEEVGHAPPKVFVVATLGTARSEAQRLADLGEQLAGALVEADHRTLRVVGLLVEVQHLLHPPDEPGALLGWDHPALGEVRAQFVF
jgi:hypothetical protein